MGFKGSGVCLNKLVNYYNSLYVFFNLPSADILKIYIITKFSTCVHHLISTPKIFCPNFLFLYIVLLDCQDTGLYQRSVSTQTTATGAEVKSRGLALRKSEKNCLDTLLREPPASQLKGDSEDSKKGIYSANLPSQECLDTIWGTENKRNKAVLQEYRECFPHEERARSFY